MDELDKSHWFLIGLGSSFEHFSVTYRAIKPAPTFLDLVSQAESHELFLASLQESPPIAAFTTQQQRSSQSSHGGSTYRGRGRGSNYGGRGRGKRPPHCQLCRTNGHYASSCPDLASFARKDTTPDETLAQAFHAQCHVTNRSPDSYVDSGATSHKMPSTTHLDSSSPYTGHEQVIFGNGKVSPISHIGTSTLLSNLVLSDVLVVPNLTKNLLSISKLTQDSPVDVLFSNPFFTI